LIGYRYDIINCNFNEKGGFMLNKLSLIMSILVIGMVYIVLFRIVKIMHMDLKGTRGVKKSSIDYALEVSDAPDNIGVLKGAVYPIHTVTNIGRKEDNHIIIDDPFISSHHARIFVKEGRLYIKDLDSTNGTVKNSIEIDEIEELYNGDTVEIGRIIFKVIG
jgi:hypothetical protein